MGSLIWPEHIAAGELETAVDADGLAVDPDAYEPDPAGGWRLNAVLREAQDEREARLAAQDAEMARLQARIEALAVRRALGEELRAVGVEARLCRAAVAMLADAWRFSVADEPDDEGHHLVQVVSDFGPQPLGHAVMAWAAGEEGQPFLSRQAAAALARTPAAGAFLLH